MNYKWWWRFCWAVGLVVNLNPPGLTRPIPDETLGNERSTVTEDVIRGTPGDRIRGGATRGRNLFHSFREFNVETGRGAYFENPVEIENIFSRVTGRNPSQIDGRLGVIQAGSTEVLGNANLFFINPNGIIFGQNGSLDIGGSFIGTTANVLQFRDQGLFSATNPEAPALLTVNPSAFLFNQLPVGGISNNSIAPAGVNNLGAAQRGLRVPDGRSLLLIGGDIIADGGRLNALGGRIELIGLSGNGRIDLSFTNNDFRTSLSTNSPLSNISLVNDAFVNTAGTVGGEITVHSNRLNLIDGGQLATATVGSGDGGNITINASQVNLLGTGTVGADGVTPGSGLFSFALGSGNAGNVVVNTNQMRLEKGGQIFASSAGSGQAGSIVITADTIELLGTSTDGRIRSGFVSEANNVGNAGDITILTRQLDIRNGATVSSSTFGTGQAGNLAISAHESVNLTGTGNTLGRSIGSNLVTNSQGDGNAGILSINTRQLTLQNGGIISASTGGSGQGGEVNIDTDTIEISSALADGQLQQSSIGNIATGTGEGGNINISTRILALRDRGVITTSTSGQGQGGDITINASETIDLRGGLFSDRQFENSALLTGTTGSGDAGRLTLNTNQLLLQDRAQISAATSSTGRGGNIDVTANSVELIGVPNSSVQTGINNETFASASGGRAGDVILNVGQLSIANGALISAGTSGSGRGGNLLITANVVDLAGGSGLTTGTTISGAAGDIALNTRQLFIREGSSITAATAGAGQGGSITVEADTIKLAGISPDRRRISNIATNAIGNRATGGAGQVNISTRQLTIRDGATLSTATFNQGQGGNLRITAEDAVVIAGSATIAGTTIPSGISAETRGAGRAGSIRLNAGQLRMQNGGFVSASTSGSGRAGNIRINTDSIYLVGQTENSHLPTSISSVVASNATGNAGNIRIEARESRIQNRATIAASTQGRGDGGNIFIQLGEDFKLNQGFVTSGVFAGGTGDGGNIIISARSLTANRGSQISTVVSRPSREQENNSLQAGRGDGGNIQVTADSINLSGTERRGFSSGLLALSERGADGDAGNITVRTGDFRVADGAIVVASTFNWGDGGDIKINADNFEAIDGGQVVTNTRSSGEAGRITLNVANETILSGTDPYFQNRQERAKQYTEQSGVIDRISDVIVNQGAASGLFANTATNSLGNGGSVTLNTNTLNLNDRARISARSAGRGTAGDIQINTENLNANDSTLETAAVRSSGGTIQINLNDRTGRISLNDSNITTNSQDQGGNISLGAEQIRLRGDSDITTSSGGDGGNIDLTAASIIAFDDSDILANSSNARGGNITLDTPAFFGSGYVPNQTAPDELDGNNRVDVNASGSTASGTIQTPDTSFIQNSLSDLPANAIDPDTLLANSCIARTREGGTFLITGTGGLLTDRPDAIPLSSYPTDTVRTEPDDSNWQPGYPIMEPQGVYQLPDGELILSRECQ